MSGISTADRLASLFAPLLQLSGISAVSEIDIEEDAFANEDSTVVDRLRELIARSDTSSVVFQSVIVACLQIVSRVRLREELVAEASISLAQSEKLQRLLGELSAVERALDGALSEQGRCMLDMSGTSVRPTADSRWWYALSEAIQELEEGTERMASLVGNQPRGTDVRRLAGTVVRLLHKHHAQLVLEAEEWMA